MKELDESLALELEPKLEEEATRQQQKVESLRKLSSLSFGSRQRRRRKEGSAGAAKKEGRKHKETFFCSCNHT